MLPSFIASFLDPVALAIFGGLGALAGTLPHMLAMKTRLLSTITAATLCMSAALAVGYFLPDFRMSLRLIPDSMGAVEDSHNPWEMIRSTKYEQHYLRFVDSRSEAQTRAIMRKLDLIERDCQVITGDLNQYTVWSSCRTHTRWATEMAGIVQFIIGLAGMAWWRHRGRRSRTVKASN